MLKETLIKEGYSPKEIEKILDFIEKEIIPERNKLISWEATISYNRGLGNEYITLGNMGFPVNAASYQEAQKIVNKKVDEFLRTLGKKGKINQVVVRPKN